MWTETNATPPELFVNHAIAALAEVSEAKIEPGDEHNSWNKDEQCKRLMPQKQRERDESAEDHRCSDGDATMPEAFLAG